MDGQVSGRIKYRAVVWLCVLTIIAVAGAAFSGCGWMMPDMGDEAGRELVGNIQGSIAEGQIVALMTQVAGQECAGMDFLDTTKELPDFAVTMSSWELSAVRIGGGAMRNR